MSVLTFTEKYCIYKNLVKEVSMLFHIQNIHCISLKKESKLKWIVCFQMVVVQR